ncbi:MAG TPA: hypothetical protein VKB67_05115, partial [Rhizomicrobium sp.]|nr:hypothetical protein [Rhizomicrobium sp.]
MKPLALLSSVFALGAASAAFAVEGPMPTTDQLGVQIIYQTSAAQQCFNAAQTGTDLGFGLEHCNTAVIDPMTIYRAQTFVNRGIIRFDMGDNNGALSDFKIALN